MPFISTQKKTKKNEHILREYQDPTNIRSPTRSPRYAAAGFHKRHIRPQSRLRWETQSMGATEFHHGNLRAYLKPRDKPSCSRHESGLDSSPKYYLSYNNDGWRTTKILKLSRVTAGMTALSSRKIL